VENPGRNLPLGILTSVVLVTVLYVCTMIIVTGVLPVPDVVASVAPLADAGGVVLGAAGAMLVGIGGILATVSTGNAAILSSSRYPFAMARDALMHPWIRRIHPSFRTPSRSILVTGGVMIALALLLDVEGLAKLGGVFGMLVFALVNLSVVVLRWTSPEWYRPTFRVPLSPIIPVAGAILALVPIPQLGTLSHVSAAGFVGIGLGWYHWRRRAAEREGVPIEPPYGLRDKLQEMHQVQSLEDKKEALAARHLPEEQLPDEEVVPRVVVELVEGEPCKQLLWLAAACGSRYEAPVDVVTVTEVPFQSPLESDLPEPPRPWLEKLHRRMEEHGVPLRLHRVLARDRAHAVLAFADPGTRVVLLEWKRAFRFKNLLGSHVDTVVRKSPARVAILKYRGHRRYERILVATAGSPYATAEVELADAVAGFTGASVTFMMVLPPDASAVREEKAREYLASLNAMTRSEARLLLARGDDVAGEVLAAGRAHDLIILGSTREISLRTLFGRHFVGRIADEIAERADGSVLITRDPGFARRIQGGLLRWLSASFHRLRGRPADSWQGATVGPGPGTRIEPFPRGEDRERARRSRRR
jgi:nucleotide-binding universal stress UspA family protein